MNKIKNNNSFYRKDITSKKLINIEFEKRLSSKSIENISNNPELLKGYLEKSIKNNFAELLFRLTHEIYTEKKAKNLWGYIKAHNKHMTDLLGRDPGILVASLDYLYNISKDIKNPKIMDDANIEATASFATKDKLTGLYRKEVFEYTLKRKVLEHRKAKLPLSLIIIDVDKFKAINDTHGHIAGDRVLKAIGNLILTSIRKNDFPCRYGGDEFAIILPGTPYNNATLVADKIREKVAKIKSTVLNEITVSTGVSSLQYCTSIINTSKELFINADMELYKMKLR